MDPKRVLFVDDEIGVLQGLQRMLFEVDAWEMEFVDSAEKALRALERERFDVIVTDMCMPGMDGAMLLGRVHAQQPRVVRIILTGHSELEATFRAMPVAHSFLTKPCKPGLVQELIGRCCELSSLLERDEPRTLAGGVVSLPVQPHLYERLLQAVADPRVDIAKIAGLVRDDIGLSSKVLHLTNSAFFGMPCNFVNVDRALSYIGASMFRRLVLSRRVFEAHGHACVADVTELERDQQRAFACANIAQRIAPRPELRDDAYLAGLFHDVGKLMVAGTGGDAPGHASDAAPIAPSASLDQRARLGAYLLGLWGLPRTVVEAVAYQHAPGSARGVSQELATVLHVANRLACALDDERAGRGAGELEIDVGHLERMGALGKLDEWRQLSRSAWDRESA